MTKKIETEHERKIGLLRKAAESIPFFLIALVFFVNLIAGILADKELLTIMVRSIIAVVLFAVLGHFIGKTLKSIADTLEKKGEPGAKASVIDVITEPDDSDLLKELRETEEG